MYGSSRAGAAKRARIFTVRRRRVTRGSLTNASYVADYGTFRTRPLTPRRTIRTPDDGGQDGEGGEATTTA